MKLPEFEKHPNWNTLYQNMFPVVALRKEEYNAIREHIAELEQQRDELLAALEYHQQQTRPIQRTIDAIAKARGQ